MSNDLIDNELVTDFPLKYIERQKQVSFAVRLLERGSTRGNTQTELEQKGYSVQISERLVEEAIVSLREKRLKNGKRELWSGIALVVICAPFSLMAWIFIAGLVTGITGIIKGAADIKSGKRTF